MDENEIIKGCLKNSPESQKALYNYYYTKMLGVCLRYSKDSTEAKEILHEGFFKVFTNLKNFKAPEPFEGWIKKIMVNAAIDYLHKNKQNLIVSTFNANKSVANTLEELTDEELISNINKEEILKAVQELTPAYRKVFNLHLIEAYSHKQIAEMLDISEETSEANLSKAKFNLRKNIQQIITKPHGK
ncbi:MAG: sigma-70 family RNA polymerase sigma factor [Bacteroidetes bacterium]|nr:sigma-70 family RNA polymerase sigma factor [Bacteroidota bacterium]